jgi:hypothetical protein
MRAYNSILFAYVLDVEHNKVYFSNQHGIQRMNLDCTQLETMTTQSAYQMTIYEGTMYFIGGNDGYLYKMDKGGKCDQLDDTAPFEYLQVTDGTLYYGANYDGSDSKSIRLSVFDPDAWVDENTVDEPSASISRSRSFGIQIHFSEVMDREADWGNLVVLADDKGNPKAAHLLWSEDGKTLTVRPKSCVVDLDHFTVYVAKGAKSDSGGALEKGYRLPVDIVDEK